MKRMLIAGNWKMHKTLKEAEELASDIFNWVETNRPKSDVAVCPPFPFLHTISKIIAGTKIYLGAQNCYHEPEGAFTGEVSPPMLVSVGCKFVIIGHSERRTYFSENDQLINAKIQAALRFNLSPIFCIGETLQERQENRTYEIVERQIKIGLNNISIEQIRNIVIAYEPVWAIGTGVSANTEQIDEAHRFIRKLLINTFGPECNDTLILYGGSLNSKNAKEILSLPDVNGGLIGKASLDSKEFTKIIEYAEQSI
ncbi:MAG: triose-phosphate isomerase [Ignavibacteria bacterium]|nr:triose-phosphate isomerase [Ignavibacteria bacterium]